MGVIIDDIATPFLLGVSTETPYLFTGTAPIASKGYRYTRVNSSGIQAEPFLRSPIASNSLNEFYGRSTNIYSVPTFPQLYTPLSSIHRIKTNIHQDDQIPNFFFSGNKVGVREMHSNIFSKIKIELNLTYIGSSHVQTINGIKIKVAGRGTRTSHKASYKINLGKGNSLFGFQKIKLRSLVTDPSYVREKLSSDLIKSFGLAASGFSFARVFIDNKPYGLYGIQEDFENPWLVNEFNNGEKDYSQGILYNANINANLAFLGNNESLYTRADNAFNDPLYQIKETPSKNDEKVASDFQQLIAFTEFLATAPTTQSNAAAIWNEKIDTDSVLRSLAIEVIAGNTDGYICGQANYYLYSDPRQNARLIFIPSDMDMTFGSSSKYSCNETIRGNYENFPNFKATLPLLHILQIPEFKSTFDELIKKAVSIVNILYSRIDILTLMIKDDVYWDKSIARDYINLPEEAGMKANITLVLESENLSPVIFSDYFERVLHNNISFEEAINGTINRPSIMGLKQWIFKAANSYLKN